MILATIEQANKQDLEAILQLQKACYQSEAAIYNDYNIPPLLQDMNALEKEFAQQVFLKAVTEGKIIGSVRGFMDEETCFVGKLIVKSNFQNQGIGKRLLDSMESAFPMCKRLELFTGHKSSKNLYLYSKSGYKEFRKEAVNSNMTMIYLEKLK
ncbi:MAG TPA: GNAT family N-acetyltransferase [Prolixibacteraceae bacterium]|nr:GNAT family N-acetyltransferase [Prolixibacteraceae bacterium]